MAINKREWLRKARHAKRLTADDMAAALGCTPGGYYRIETGNRRSLLDLDTGRGSHAGYGWISLLYLCPEYRYRGLGVQLLGRAVAKYRRLGRRSIRLHVAEDNTAALAFYRANGFEELSREPGAHAPLLLMEKTLRRLSDERL